MAERRLGGLPLVGERELFKYLLPLDKVLALHSICLNCPSEGGLLFQSPHPVIGIGDDGVRRARQTSIPGFKGQGRIFSYRISYQNLPNEKAAHGGFS